MSVNYYSYAVIGCQIPKEKLYQEKTIRIEHHHPVHPVDKYCSICGKELEETIVEEICIEDKIDELEVVYSTDQEEIFIGFSIGAKDGFEFKFMDISNTLTMKEDVKKELEPLGLWDEEKFGLYVIQCCSY